MPKNILREPEVAALFSAEEREFLLVLLRPHLDYYRELASNPKCGPLKREKLRFIKALWDKLE